MNKIGPKTIMIAINQGFGFRYLIQTDIFKFLQRSGNRIILLVPNSKDKFYENYKHSNVEFVLLPYCFICILVSMLMYLSHYLYI